MLEVTNLGCVRGNRRLFRDLNFAVSPGSLVQLQGPNGSGKTSLLRIICGLATPAEGKVCWRGENIRAINEEYSASVRYVGHRNGAKEELTSVENLRIASGLDGVAVSDRQARAILDRVGLAGREDLPVRLLSEGQKRRSALARLLTCRSALWLLDEVLTSLDTAAVRLMKSILEEHLGEGGMAIIATHQELNISAGSFQRLELSS